MSRVLTSLVVLVLTLVPARPAVAGELQDDLRARRARVMERLGPETLLILFSAPERTYSNDVEYEYRQDSNFYYLTGIDQPESILAIMPGNRTRKEMLFILPPDPNREHREGHMLNPAEATAQSGIETVHLTPQFEPFINAVLAGRPLGAPADEFDAFFTALGDGRARLALLLSPRPGLSGALTATWEFANTVKERFFGVGLQDATSIVHHLRQVKTAYEQKVLERSVEISSEAHLAGMRAARPGAYEYEVEAAIEYVYLARGGLGWGYPSIVGSGPNATILHYNASRRQMQAGDLLLVDAAGNYQYYTGDITRTYSITGRFTPEQKDIYAIVLAAQDEAMKVARAGATVQQVHDKTVEVVEAGLLKLGLITDASGDQYRRWYTHGSVHWIGLDVHDVGERSRPLEPGMAFVIEPGIYVREGMLEALPPTPENRAFIEKVRPAYEKYKNIGVRIEDSFLLTESGLKRLSANVPRTIEEIERFLQAAQKDRTSAARH